MKKFTTAVLAILLLATTASHAKAQELNASLKDAFQNLSTATDMGGRMNAVNKFNVIAAKWGNQWAANYYAAYANAVVSLNESDPKRRDQLIDVADKYVEKANSLNAANDETLFLNAYVAFARYSVDPPNRWQKYLNLTNAKLDEAKKANPNNPRIYYLQGILFFLRPKTYGGGKEVAKPYFEKADALFPKQESADYTKPFWGGKDNAAYLRKCSE